MVQELDLRLDGEQVTITGGELITTFDTPLDMFSVDTVINRASHPSLYKKISPYQAPNAQVYLNGELFLTGKLTQPAQNKTGSGRTQKLTGFSNTFGYFDSALKPPYEHREKTIHSLCILAGRQTATRIIHEDANGNELPNGNKFDKATITAGQSGFAFTAPLATERNLVITSTPQGDLWLTEANTDQAVIATIEEDSPNSLLQKEFSASYNYRDRFKTYTIKSRTPAGRATATAVDPNINLPRHKLATANNQIAGGIQANAEYAKNIELIKTLSQDVPIVGWNAPNGGPLFKSGQLVTLKSETFYVPDGFTYFIRQVRYILRGTEKTAVLSLIPKEIYTGEPVIEPWFS